MKQSISLIFLAVAGITFSTIAADEAVKEPDIPALFQCARIEVIGIKDKVTLKPVKGMLTAGWLKQQNLDNNYLYAQSRSLQGNAWEDMEVSFIPDKDGVVVLSLTGPLYRPKGEKTNMTIWIEFDEVTLTGAELKNGGFEKLDEEGKIADWNLKGELVKGKAQAGDNSIKVWNLATAQQNINVKKDQQVTIKAKVKRAE